jgi:predicted Fe-S protein YdhL (DUF1289 family)
MDGATGWCEGCLRTLEEIAHWSLLDDDEKRAIWSALPLRRSEWRRLRVLGPDEALEDKA